ncbi:MAG: hypothetical protein CL386_00200 [Acidiferrobacter sp.]|nr:hypothetical protein [Acidiferrobacter sp.]MBJ17534.1 hypothetical protein [Euryarchaeota archaeon]|tara:strand:- start:265 stop:450 length:186 start_codon:yes stop_codon:yes gene_type:complete
MSQGGSPNSKSLNRRIDSLSRERDSVSRILEQAQLEKIRDGLDSLKSKMEAIEVDLTSDKT